MCSAPRHTIEQSRAGFSLRSLGSESASFSILLDSGSPGQLGACLSLRGHRLGWVPPHIPLFWVTQIPVVLLFFLASGLLKATNPSVKTEEASLFLKALVSGWAQLLVTEGNQHPLLLASEQASPHLHRGLSKQLMHIFQISHIPTTYWVLSQALCGYRVDPGPIGPWLWECPAGQSWSQDLNPGRSAIVYWKGSQSSWGPIFSFYRIY